MSIAWSRYTSASGGSGLRAYSSRLAPGFESGPLGDVLGKEHDCGNVLGRVQQREQLLVSLLATVAVDDRQIDLVFTGEPAERLLAVGRDRLESGSGDGVLVGGAPPVQGE